MNYIFTSDNTASIHPNILTYLKNENYDYANPYGNDEATKNTKEIVKNIFPGYEVLFANSGTSANVLGVSCFLESYNSIICSPLSHIHTSEAGAFENLSGAKIYTTSKKLCKIKPEDILPFLKYKDSLHVSNPACIMITQATEYGLSYTNKEIKELVDFCHKNDLFIFLDGARLLNSIAYNCQSGDFKNEMETFSNLGLDGFTAGFIKNGGFFGDLILLAKDNSKALKKAFHLQKHYLQLNSKQRFLSAGIKALLENDIYIENAKNANYFANYIYNELKKFDLKFFSKPQSNILLFYLKENLFENLNQNYKLHFVEEEKDIKLTRLVCSYATTKSDADKFLDYFEKQHKLCK